MKTNPFPRGTVCWCGFELLTLAVLSAFFWAVVQIADRLQPGVLN